MKAVVRDVYGSPDVLRLEDIPKPVPGANEVLVKVSASSIAKGDLEILRASPIWVRLSGFGLINPKSRILGYNLSGRVESVGSDVTQFQVGDEVFADTLHCGLGAFAEFVCVPERAAIARKPAGITFEEAASVPEAGFIALQALRDKGQLQDGQKVLINGAGGGAGSFAIQLAKSLGAEVTGVDSTGKLDWMRSLGADHVVDFTQQDVTDLASQFDLILDIVGVQSIGTWKRALRSGGTYMAAGGSVAHIARSLLIGGFVSATSDKKIGMVAVTPNKDDLHSIIELLESGKVAATIDQRFTLDELPQAIRYLEAGKSKGKIVITMQ